MALKNNIAMTSSDRVKGVPYVSKGVNLCRLPNGLRCLGCCGMDFLKEGTTKEEFLQAMMKSTKEYSQHKSNLDFKKRVAPNDVHDCGACKQLILTDDSAKTPVPELAKKKRICFTCPLHPKENDGEELRHGECDFDFMCEAQKAWHVWDHETRDEFMKFLVVKNLDWFEYSKRMNNDSLLEEFMDS